MPADLANSVDDVLTHFLSNALELSLIETLEVFWAVDAGEECQMVIRIEQSTDAKG